VSIEYVDLVDYVAIATEVTGLDVETIIGLPNLPLAESALHAPAAGFGEHEFYPDFIDQAAVLITRLARNHPLPDGNNAPPGSRSDCSSTSTTGRGTQCQPSTKPNTQSSPSQPATGTNNKPPTGYAHTSPPHQNANTSRDCSTRSAVIRRRGVCPTTLASR
jgi:hypothetical protein